MKNQKNFFALTKLTLTIVIFVSWQCSGLPLVSNSKTATLPQAQTTQKSVDTDVIPIQALEGEWFAYVAAKNQGSKLIIQKQRAIFFKVNGYGTMPIVFEGDAKATDVFLSVGDRLLAYSFADDKQTLTLKTSNVQSLLHVTSPSVYTKKLSQNAGVDGTWVSQDGSIRGTFTRKYFKLEKKVLGMYFDAVDGTYEAYGKSLLLTTEHIRDQSTAWISDTQYHGAEYSLAENKLTLVFEPSISADLEISGSLVMYKK